MGYDVARMLSCEEHDVVVIDQDADAIRQVHEKLDVMAICRQWYVLKRTS